MNISRLIKAVALGLVGCLLVSTVSVLSTCEAVSEQVVRLHVLAATDSEADQAMKLLVRDAVLSETDGLLDGIRDRDTALVVLTKSLDDIERAANRCLQTNGSDDTAHVSLCGGVYFPSRSYESVTLPAGEYEALRVVIGQGQGKNWWCVAFPPMCLAGACDTALSDVLDDEERRLVEEPTRYRVQLKVIEWVAELKQTLTSK